MIKIKKLEKNVKLPSKAHESDAGFDLYANEAFHINPGEIYNVPLGFAIEIPKHTVALVQGKSGLAKNNRITTIGNVIDSGYRGECHALLINHGYEPIYFNQGDKVAQLLIIKLFEVDKFKEVEELSDTSRGSGGFGSTGR